MQNIIIGFIFVILGIWGVVTHWYQFLDLLWVVIPMLMIFAGIFTLLAGIGNYNNRA